MEKTPKSALAMRIDRPIANFDRETALALAKSNPDTAADLIIALIKKNTAELPNTTFVKRGGELLKKINVRVRLTDLDGHLTGITRGVVDPDNDRRMKYIKVWEPSLSGFRRMNEAAGLQIIRPEAVIVNGQRQMNPYVEVDPETKKPVVAYSRTMCVGYAPTGSLVATDVTVRVDVGIYLIESIQAKMKKLDKEADRLGIYGVRDDVPESEGKGKQKQRWVFYPLDSVTGLGVWVNVAAPEVAGILQDHVTRLKFMDRLAQSFSERNAYKAHPGMPNVSSQSPTALASVIGWTTSFDRDDIDNIRALAEADRLDDFVDKEGKRVVVESVIIDDPDDSDIAAGDQELQSELADDPARDKDGDDDEEKAPPAEDVLDAALSAYNDVCEAFSIERARAVLAEAGVETMESATDEELRAVITACKAALNPESTEEA